MDSGQTSPTPVTAPQSPIDDDDDSEAATPLALGSRNPFLASIIAATWTPSTGRGPTTSGTSSRRSTRELLGPERVEAWELRQADVEARTSRHHPNTREDMAYYLATHRGAPFHFGEPSSAELVARAYANRNRELFRTHPRPTTPRPTRANPGGGKHPQRTARDPRTPTRRGDSGERITRTDFQYNWESVYPGFHPEETGWGSQGRWPIHPQIRRILGITRDPQQAASLRAQDQEKPTWKMLHTHGGTKPTTTGTRSNHLPATRPNGSTDPASGSPSG